MTNVIVKASREGEDIHCRTVDNPVESDSAFYAFLMALIDIIKEENAYKKIQMFNQWIALDPSIAEYFEAICSFDFNRPNNKLLHRLQRSLRKITHYNQLDELKRVCSDPENYTDPENLYKVIVSNSTYIKFSEFYYNPETDARFNELADSDQMFNAILTIDRNQVQKSFEHLTLVPIFLSLIYGENVSPKSITPDRLPMSGAPIIEAMEGMTQDAFWGTYLNLDYLARAFGVNFHPLENLKPLQEFKDIKGRHTVTINHNNNVYRTTEVTYALSSLKTSDGLTAEKKEAGDAPLPSPEEAQEQLPANETKDFDLLERGKLAKIYKLSPGKNNNKALRESWHTKKVTCSLTAEQLEAERLAEEMEQEKLAQTEKLLELGGSETAEKAATTSEHEKRQIDFLRGVATKAVISYIDYSNSIWFSLFHRHGRSGRIRAQEFLTQILMIDDLDEAKVFLVSFLSNNNNGNTYPHSFRTMLLNELLKDPKPTLQYTSEHFNELLDELSNVLGVHLGLLEYLM